jgi:hypothetical protein
MIDASLAKEDVEKIDPGSVARLVRLAAQKAYSGRIVMRRGSRSCSLYFGEGRIIHAKTNNPDHRLGEILRNEFGLDERPIQVAVQLGRIHNQPLGMVLLRRGVIKPGELYQSLVRQVEILLQDAVLWDSGICYLHPGVKPEEDVVLLRVDPKAIVGQAPPPAPPPPQRPRQATSRGRAASKGKVAAAVPKEPPPPPAPTKPAATPPPRPAPPPPPAPRVREERTVDVDVVRAFIAEKKGVDEHYGVLGLVPTATPEEVRDAYSRLVRAWHPDRLAAVLTPTEMDDLQGILARINAAWTALGNAERRARYDQERKGAMTARKEPPQTAPEGEARRLFAIGRQFIKEERFAEAVESLRKSCQVDPTRSQAWFYLGAANFRIRRLRQAEEALIRAIDLDGSKVDYYLALCQVYRKGKLFGRALDMVDRALRWEPENAGAIREKRLIREEMKSGG